MSGIYLEYFVFVFSLHFWGKQIVILLSYLVHYLSLFGLIDFGGWVYELILVSPSLCSFFLSSVCPYCECFGHISHKIIKFSNFWQQSTLSYLVTVDYTLFLKKYLLLLYKKLWKSEAKFHFSSRFRS